MWVRGANYKLHFTSERVEYILFRKIDEDGTLGFPGQPTDFDSGVIRSNPDVAGDGDDFAIVFERQLASTNRDIEGFFEEGGGNIAVGFHRTLTVDEPGSIPSRDQLDPAVALTAEGFTYAYREKQAAGNFSIFAASVQGNTLGSQFLEGHVGLGVTALNDSQVELGSMFSAGELRNTVLAVWTRQPNASDFDVIAALYEHP